MSKSKENININIQSRLFRVLVCLVTQSRAYAPRWRRVLALQARTARSKNVAPLCFNPRRQFQYVPRKHRSMFGEQDTNRFTAVLIVIVVLVSCEFKYRFASGLYQESV